MSRLPLPDLSTASPDVAAIYAQLPLDLRLFRMLTAAPGAFEPWLRFGAALLGGLRLSARLREVAVLEVARLSACEYELAQHRPIALAVGLGAEELADLTAGRDERLQAADAAVVRFVRDVVSNVRAGDDTLAEVRGHLDDGEVVELLLVIGHYRAVAMLAETTGLEPDDPAGMAVVAAAEDLPAGA